MAARKIAIGSWAFLDAARAEDSMPFEAVMGKIAGLGFDGVALAGMAPHAEPALYPARADRLRLRRILLDNRLEALEAMPDVWRFNPLVREKEYVDYMENFIRFMDECGFPILRVDTCCPPTLPDGVGRERAFAKIVELFRHVAAQCAARGLSVLWEFEPTFLFNKPSEVTGILDAVGMANFNLLFDTSHAYMCAVAGAGQSGEKETLKGGVREFVARVAGKIGSVHLADCDGTLRGPGGTSTHSPFGSGRIDFDEIIPALLDEGGYRFGWWTIDQLPPADWDAAARGKRFVDELNARYS